MSKGLIFTLCGIGAVVVLGIAVVSWYVGTYNHAIDLEKQFTASVENREALYDNMVKQVQEKFKVAKFERKTVIAMIDAVTEGRTGGNLFKMVQEQSPAGEVSQDLFKEVLATIGGKRDEFTRSQQNIMQIVAEHAKLREKIPSSIVVGSRSPLEWTVVSSTATKETMESGVDDRDLLGDDEP
jgi:hypothetical protein